MNDSGPLVSVVVPAFNAARTVSETLHSVSQQSYRNLEVTVVNDGSTDETADIVRRYSRTDPRVRMVSKPNGGVASARNEGIKASKGEFIAFIDADDLWHPTKIAKQLRVLLAGGPDMALVYSPFRLIDADGKVLASPHKYGVNGWVLYRHFYSNIVGNGSALLIRKSVLEEFGGFDTWLRREGAEGCEDLLLQLRIAAHYRFGEVSEYLVGYRRLEDNMSSNTEQMIRSGILAVNQAYSEFRHIPGLSASAILDRYEWQRLRAKVRKGHPRESLLSFARQFAARPSFVASALWIDFAALMKKINSTGLSRIGWGPDAEGSLRHFYEFDPKAGIDLNHNTPTSRALRRLAILDELYRPTATAGAAYEVRQGPGPVHDTTMLRSFVSRDLDNPSTYQEG
jgi:glycosyltransferase involved in cell wall biosynthesis